MDAVQQRCELGTVVDGVVDARRDDRNEPIMQALPAILGILHEGEHLGFATRE